MHIVNIRKFYTANKNKVSIIIWPHTVSEIIGASIQEKISLSCFRTAAYSREENDFSFARSYTLHRRLSTRAPDPNTICLGFFSFAYGILKKSRLNFFRSGRATPYILFYFPRWWTTPCMFLGSLREKEPFGAEEQALTRTPSGIRYQVSVFTAKSSPKEIVK